MGKKIKLYTHNLSHIELKRPSAGRKNWLYELLYYVGLFFLYILKLPFLACAKLNKIILIEFKKIKPQSLKLEKKFRRKNIAKSLILLFILSCVSFGAIKAISLAAKGIEIKNNILKAGTYGAGFLTDAKNSLLQKNFSKAKADFEMAYESFGKGKRELEEQNAFFKIFLNILPFKKDAQHLLASAQLISKSGLEMNNILKELEGAKFTAQGVAFGSSEPKIVFKNLENSLETVKKYLDAAQTEMDSVKGILLPGQYREKLSLVKNEFANTKAVFDNLHDILKLALNFGAGKKNIVVFFENNNELRPSGGFMGTFGSFEVEYGKINKMNISSIYDLDGQLKENILPPIPILRVNDKWFLRDSNWFADFPASALKMSDFYEKEGNQTPDMIITMTTQPIIDLLKILGPVEMPKYKVILTPENFIEQTQVVSSVTYENYTSQNKPKQILADLMPVIFQKIGEAKTDLNKQILSALKENISQKQILFYAKDTGYQKELEKLNWSGKVLETDRDYLFIVSSNLGGTKTDLFIEQTIDLKSKINDNGEITDELTIIRKNNLPKLENAKNISYIRILAPKGAVLMENSGFDFFNLPSENTNNYTVDQDVYNLQKDTVREVFSGTNIGTESEKTVFGNWLTVEGGEEKTIKLVYKLPFKLKTVDRLSLLVQKQPGTLEQTFNYRVEYSGRKSEWQNFTFNTSANGLFEFNGKLNKDLFLAEVLRK